MVAFEVYLNGERLCTAGIGDDGVMNAMVDHVKGEGRDQLFLRVGGLVGSTKEYVMWQTLDLKHGDEIRVKIANSDHVDEPKSRFQRESNE